MSEEKKIFDKKFVHFMWDDSLEGKEGFVSDSIDSLITRVNETIVETIYGEQGIFGLVSYGDSTLPFLVDRIHYRFFYYDPLYNVKLAWKQGKTIQYRSHCSFKWEDCDDPGWSENYEYRVKPEEPEETYEVVFKKNARCMVYGPAEIIPDSDNCHVLFEGTEDECGKYMREKLRFNLIMAAYYCDGKQIQYKSKNSSEPWIDCFKEPSWCDDVDYRVKPEEPSFRVYKFEGTETQRRMTYRELAKWVAQGNGQVKNIGSSTVTSRGVEYDEGDDNKECPDRLLIRGWDEEEWHEPEVE